MVSVDKTYQPTVICKVKTLLQQLNYGARYPESLKVCLPYKPEHFTNVAFIQHTSKKVTVESVMAVAHVTHNGDIITDNDPSDNVLPQVLQCNDYYKSCKKSDDIFKLLDSIDSVPNREPFLLLIEGAPGMGKSIICKEIALHLPKQQNNDLTFLLHLHETNVHCIDSFKTFFECTCPHELHKESKNVSDYLSSTEGKNVTIIIDGYERLFTYPHSNSSSYIMDIINRKVLQFQLCDFIISTCHTAFIDLNHYKNWYRIELLGFTENLQQHFLECSFEQSKSHNSSGKLKSHLNSNSTLKSLCFHPLFLNHVIFLYQKYKTLPKFKTEMINRFACITILWNLRNHLKLNILDITSLYDKLPSEYQNVLKRISEVAFNTIQQGKVVSELQKNCNAKSDVCKLVAQSYQETLGFAKAFTLFDNSESREVFSFFQNSLMQHFLAAFFVLLSGNNIMNLWAETKWSSKYINVWAFYFGLAKAVKKEFEDSLLDTKFTPALRKQLSSKLKKDKIKCLYLVCCFIELPNEEIYQQSEQVVVKNETIIDIGNFNLTNESLNIVISFLSWYMINHLKNLNLSNCSLDDDKLEYLLQLFLYRLKYMPKIDTLDLSNNSLTMKSVNGIFKIAHSMNALKVLLLQNKKVKNEEIFKSLVAFTETQPLNDCNLKVVENDNSLFLFGKMGLCAHQSINALTNMYIIRCSLDGTAFKDLMAILRTHKTLLLLCLYDNKLPRSNLVEVLKISKHLKSILIFEKLVQDINLNEIYLTTHVKCSFSQVLLVSAKKLIAQGATDHQIFMALEYNSSIVHFQLNNCHITNRIMSKIADMLNGSLQQWSLLDLSGSDMSHDSLREFCNILNGNSIVNSINFSSNNLTSLSLITELIQCLKPNTINVSKNNFIIDENNVIVTSISMTVAQKLFTYDNQLCFILTCDGDNVLYCHKCNHTAITEEADMTNTITQVFVNDCIVSGERLLKLLDNNDSLTYLYLSNVKWSGGPPQDSICENVDFIKEILTFIVNKFDTDISRSRIISTNDIFIAHKCHYNLLKWHLTQKLLPLPSNLRLFYVQNSISKSELQHSNIVADYFSKQNVATEIMLCNNGLSQNSIYNMIKKMQCHQFPKSVLICELQKQLLGIKIARQLLSISNCSFVVIEEKVVIGKQATSMQVGRCLSLISALTTIVRFISCNFNNEQYNSLVSVLNHHTALEEFSLYECNTNEIWTKQLVEALQVRTSLKSLLLSCNSVTPLIADSIATALTNVIGNNTTLEKVGFKFNNLHSSACSKILNALSNAKHLKHFRFCDGQLITKESVDQLKAVIANNPSLELVNLRNNRLLNTGIKAIAEAFKSIYHLKLLALNGNQVDEEAADDIAFIITNNKEMEKLLLYNNLLKCEGIQRICQALEHHESLLVFRIGHNCIQDDAAESIAQVICRNPLLKVVDIGNNRLFMEGMMKITSQLEKSTYLEKLLLGKNYTTCTDKVATSIAKIVINNIHLKVLHLDNNNFSVSGMSAIAESLSKLIGLKELTVNNTGCTADHIATMITNNLVLEVLDIGGNKLKSEGISIISEALTKLSHLKVLGLYGNDITGDAADDIAEVIYKLPLLQKLLLSNNAFGVVGIQTICNSLMHNGVLKLLQLNNTGITEEVAVCIAGVIDSNPLLECLYLGNNRLQDTGANVILKSLHNKKTFKALALSNNYVSEAVADNIIQFVTNNSELEELLLNNNSIGTTGIIKVCKCVKDISTLRILDLADNNVSDETNDALLSVIESNTALEIASMDVLFNNSKLATTINMNNNLKCLSVDCKLATKNDVYNLSDFVLTNRKIKEIKINNLAEEIQVLSPLNPIETVVIIKTNINEGASHVPALHSVFIKDRVEIVCVKNNVLLKSKVLRMISVKSFKRLMLVFTKVNCYTDQDMRNLATAVTNHESIHLLIISKLNATKYNRDVLGIVVIDQDQIILFLTGNNLGTVRVTKLINNLGSIKTLMVCTERLSDFTDQNINEIIDVISKINKLEKFTLRTNAMPMKTMEAVISCLTKAITIETVSVLNNLNIRNFDFTQKSDRSASQSLETIDNVKHQWHKIYIICALRNKLNMKILDLSGIVIDKEVAGFLASILNKTTKLENLNLANCLLGVSLKCIDLQKVTTLKYLDLSNNNLKDDEPIISMLESNTELEKLAIHENSLQVTAGGKLCTAVTNLKNLKILSIDQSVVGKDITLRLATAFSTTTEKKLFIYNRDYRSTEVLDIIGSLNNITTLTLCKRSVEIKGVSFLSAVLKTGVLLSLWQQDDILSKAEIIRSVSASRKVTTIQLLNVGGNALTEQEENTIATIFKENTQLENILLGNELCKLEADDFYAFHSEYNINHRSKGLTSKTDKANKAIPFSHNFLLKITVILKCYTNLKKLSLSIASCPCNVSQKDLVEQLAIVIANSAKLETLLLEDCSLGNEGVNVIAKAVKNLSTLKHLDLSNNGITECEDQTLKTIIKTNISLEKLYLEKNYFNATTGDRLSSALADLKNLEVLSIDQNIITRNMALHLANTCNTVAKVNKKLLIYSHDHQSTGVIEIKGTFNNINTLTLCKIPAIAEGQPMVTFILENGSVMLWWTQCNMLNIAGILRYFSSLKKITTLKLLNNSGSVLTELEMDTIATVVCENMQLENVWIGSQSLKTIHDDFVVLARENIKNKKKSEIEMQKQFTSLKGDQSGKQLNNLVPEEKLFPRKIWLKILYALQNTTNLKTLDLSGNVITEKFAEQLAIVIANSTKLEALLLRDCSLSSVSILMIANSLKNITTLNRFDISWDDITEVAANSIATCLECNAGLVEVSLDGSLQPFSKLSTAIKELHLKVLHIDHKLITKDSNYELRNLVINNSKLKCLTMKNYLLQVAGTVIFQTPSRSAKSLIVARLKSNALIAQDPSTVMTLVDEMNITVGWSQDNILASTGILRIFGAFKDIISITVFNNTFSNYTDEDTKEIMTALAGFTKLEELSFTLRGYSIAFFKSGFDSFNTLTTIKSLDLSGNRIPKNATTKLTTLLMNNSNIKELHVNHCLLTSSQVKELTNPLKAHSNINILRLHSNNIRNIFGIANDIGEMLLKNQNLHKFYVGQNKLQATGVMKILLALKHLHELTELSVGSNNITDNISDDTLQIRHCISDFLVEIITNNPKLEILGIDYVCTHAEEAGKVARALTSLSCLKLLDISGNSINEKVADNIGTLITQNPNLGKLFIANNHLGVTGISKIAEGLVNLRGLEVLDIINNNIPSEAAESVSEIIKNSPQLKVLLMGQDYDSLSKLGSKNNDVTVNNATSCIGTSTIKLSSAFINKQMLEIKRNTKLYGPKYLFNVCVIESSNLCCKLFSDNLALNSRHLINSNYNKLQSEGIKIISKALATISSLEGLSIENNDIDDEAADDVAATLANNRGVKQLWIGQNHFTSAGLVTILKSLLEKPKLLQVSQLSSGNIPRDEPRPTLEVLDLNRSTLSLKTAVDISAVDISAVLTKNYDIQQLWLEGNNLSPQSITTIAGALKKCTSISVLSLRDNNISGELADILSQALSGKYDFQQLYLGNNQLENRGVIKITEALNTTNGLLTLDLMNNNISEAAADALATIITSCKQLEQLYLGDNKLHSAGTIKIATAIQQAACRSTLRVLDMSNNGIGSDEGVANEISRAVGNTELLTVLILDDNALSVDGLLKITRSLGQSESAECMMIFSVMRNDVMISEEAKDKMRRVMADQQLTDCVMYF